MPSLESQARMEVMRRLASDLQPLNEVRLRRAASESTPDGVKPDTTKTWLRRWQDEGVVSVDPAQLYWLGPAVGMSVVSAAGAATVNSAVFDAHGRTVPGTFFWERWASLGADDLLALQGDLMARSLNGLRATRSDRLQHVCAVGVASFYGLDRDGWVRRPDQRRKVVAGGIVTRRLETVPDFDVPPVDDWWFGSDAAAEMMSEVELQPPGAAAGPLMLIKLTQAVRTSFTNHEMVAHVGARGDVASVEHLPVPPSATSELGWHVDPELCGDDKCGGDCLRAAIHPELIYRMVNDIGSGSREDVQRTLRPLAGELDDELFRRLFGDALAAHPARRKVFVGVGQILGATLKASVAQVDPAFVVLTGLLARAELTLSAKARQGPVTEGFQAGAQPLDLDVRVSTGVRYEAANGGAVDATAAIPPNEAPHQLRTTAGLALRISRDRFLPPLLAAG